MTTPLRFAATIVAAVVSASASAPACVGELSIPAEAQLTCLSATDCPADLVCSVEAGLCVPPGTVVDLAAPILVSATVDVDRLGPGDTATITLTANEPIDAVTIVDELGDSLAAVIADDLVTIAIDADARGRSGPVSLSATWQDAVGNSATVAVSAGPTIDLEPPLVVTDSLVVVASGNANVLSPAAPIAARADSGVNVAFTVDEGIVSAAAPRLVPVASPGDAGLSLGLDAVVAIVSSGTGVTVSVPPGVLQDVAGIADGAFLVAVDVVDQLANAGVLVGTAPLVVDTTPPPAPTLSLVRRAPFGDGARASASTSLAGVAADAVLVIAVPGSVSVDNAAAPPLVGRREPDDAGAFSLEIPFDIEAVRIVAVDEAGNLSQPAVAARIELVASILAPATPHRVLQRPVSGDVLVQLADRFGNDELRTGTVTTTTQPSWSPLTTRVQVRIPSPPVLAQDPVRGGTLAVAGGDTFALRGSQFVRLDVPRLPVVKGYGLATDERRGVVVLFGGDDADGVAQNGTWEWNGERWTERLRHDPAATDRPSPRVGAGVGYSQALGGVAVVNGCARDSEVGIFGCVESLVPEVWLWDGTEFTRLCGEGSCGTGPDANRPELTVDPTGALVGTGGFGPFGPGAIPFPLPPAVFTFDGARWVGRCADACAEALPADSAAYFEVESDAIAFFGTCGGTPCTARLFDGDVVGFDLLEGTTPPIPNNLAFQERPFLHEANGRLVFAVRGADANDPPCVSVVVGRPVQNRPV